ncbi:MAG: cytidine deaminase [Pyrinomonadaceae bacterium]|nr:cytidine deaminase [Pyrinomonadaceae bacterium]
MIDGDDQLVEAAKRAREFAIADFSNFRVGAALVSNDDAVFTGCNIENATYGLTVCAERVAMWKALSEGARGFKRIAVVADTEKLTSPCGACRQLIWEFCGDVPVVLANLRGDVEIYQMRDLLPRAFDATFLDKAEATR